MWWTLLPFVLVTLVVVVVPGFLVSWAAGFRRSTALGLAPLVSTGVVAVAAILAGLVGLDWGPLPILVTTALVAAAAFGLRHLPARVADALGPSRLALRARTSGIVDPANPSIPEVVDPASPSIPEVAGPATSSIPEVPRSGLEGSKPHPSSSSIAWPLAAIGLAALLGVIDSIRLLGAPQNFSQTYDNIFHLNAVRWMVEHRNGSALDMRMVTGDDPAAFYPTAWHDLASGTLLSLGATNPVAATNALIIVAVAVIWPLSCLLLVRRILASTAVGTLATGVLVASFTPMPYLLLRFGVLYPNFLGLCLLPAMMAVAVSLLELGDGPRWPIPATWLAAVVGAITLLLAHPNALLTMLCVIGSVMITAWTFRRPLARWRIAVWIGWGIAALVAYIKVRPPADAAFWGPRRSYLDAMIELVTVSPLEASVVVVPALLTIVGAFAVVWTRRGWWLLASHAALGFLWLVAAARDNGRARDYIVDPWYSDPYRLAAMLPITALPLAVVGVVFLVDKLGPVVLRRTARRLSQPVVALACAAFLLVSTQFVGGKPQMIAWTAEAYRIDQDSALVDADEYAIIGKVAELVGPDDVIAVNPWNGSSMVYALTGRQTTATHVLYEPNPDKQILVDHLDDVATDPEVCPAIEALSVDWVLDFGQTRLINNEKRHYPGWDDLSTAPGFELAARQGHASLYRVTACGLG